MTNASPSVCAEVFDIFGTRKIPDRTLNLMERLCKIRQVEVARLMVALNRYSEPLMLYLVATTPKSQLVGGERSKFATAIPETELLQMELEAGEQNSEILSLKRTYSSGALDLIAARGFIGLLLENAPIVRFLAKNNPEALSGFQNLVEEGRASCSANPKDR